jgi:hypothetical protein
METSAHSRNVRQILHVLALSTYSIRFKVEASVGYGKGSMFGF